MEEFACCADGEFPTQTNDFKQARRGGCPSVKSRLRQTPPRIVGYYLYQWAGEACKWQMHDRVSTSIESATRHGVESVEGTE